MRFQHAFGVRLCVAQQNESPAHERMKIGRFISNCNTLIEGFFLLNLYNFGSVDRHPDVDKFPKEIRDLKPVSVYVLDDKVFIELLGGLSSCRLVAYSDDFNEPIYGEKKLIDGLWLESDFMDFE